MSDGEVRIEPFRIEVPETDLTDLAARLARTRWPEGATVLDWSQGVPLAALQELCRYWSATYDWRRCEAEVAALPQCRAVIDGLGIHVLHVPSPVPDALPLVLTHGWPGSIVEFLDVIGPLTDPAAHGGDPADAFHVVCPTLPGFGWSDKPATAGWNVPRIARAWAALMAALGYDRYGAQGGDWGSHVTSSLGAEDPDHVVGIHLNMVSANPPKGRSGPWSPEEADAMAAIDHYRRQESGYNVEQSTRPQTLGYGLVDSPAGQCAWILEKLYAWTDCDGDPVALLGADRILDDVMWYWLPAAGASSARIYWEAVNGRDERPVEIPTGVMLSPHDLFLPPQEWAAARYRDIRRWTRRPDGGHFAAWERPGPFVEDVRAFFRLVR